MTMDEILYDERDPRAAFRAFHYEPKAKGGCLTALTDADYFWEPGVLEADEAPDYNNRNGFYSFKSLPEAIYNFGDATEFIFALIAISGWIVEGERGSRSEFAEIVSIIEPSRPEAQEFFDSAREHLLKAYPGVPIIERSEIKWKLIEFGLPAQPRTAPSAIMQWIGPTGDLVWASESTGPRGPDGTLPDYEMLDAAATYPNAIHSLDLRLRKVTLEAASGETYVFWDLPEEHEDNYGGTSPGFYLVFNLVFQAPQTMYRHRRNEVG